MGLESSLRDGHVVREPVVGGHQRDMSGPDGLLRDVGIQTLAHWCVFLPCHAMLRLVHAWSSELAPPPMG